MTFDMSSNEKNQETQKELDKSYFDLLIDVYISKYSNVVKACQGSCFIFLAIVTSSIKRRTGEILSFES